MKLAYVRMSLLDADLKPDKDVVPVNIPVGTQVANVRGWSDFLNWLKENPDFIALIIAAILTLLGGIAPPPPQTPPNVQR